MHIKTNCVVCKGRFPQQYCGRMSCPIVAKAEARFKVQDIVTKEDFYGNTKTPFVGRFGYPMVNVGILAPNEIKEDAELYDAPRTWSSNNFQISKIVDYRSALINSRLNMNIKDQNKLLDIAQEIGMASKPVDLEINLKEKPKFSFNTSNYLAPTGPNAKLKKANITSNPKIDQKVDKVVSDTDLKANSALTYLYEKGFDENFLSKLLSVGTLGIKKARKLVPTRWSITAIDDNIGKKYINEIKNYSETDYLSFFSGYLGNYYLNMLFPESYFYELFETYMPSASFNISSEVKYTTDYEPYDGRKDYAYNTAGGYYAARLPILEQLSKMKRQASILSIRVITGEYTTPLGVWVCREASRKSMQSKPLNFASKELMLEYAKKLVKKKFGYDISKILSESKLLKNLKFQKKLTAFT